MQNDCLLSFYYHYYYYYYYYYYYDGAVVGTELGPLGSHVTLRFAFRLMQ